MLYFKPFLLPLTPTLGNLSISCLLQLVAAL